jgi:threonyl-tRNA synthetase
VYARPEDLARVSVDIKLREGVRFDELINLIRNAQLEKVPYMLVIGQKEAEAASVAVRHRVRGDVGVQTVEAFLEAVMAEVRDRSL